MTDIVTASDIVSFWCQELEPKDWYVANDDVDTKIRDRFLATWEDARSGGLTDWLENAAGALAYLILTDQFSRNMFRGDGRSFATDGMAVAAAKKAIAAGHDMATSEPARQFFYVPFMHAETLDDQDLAITYFETRMPDTGHNNIDHAHAHRWVIAEFGRFPYRNDALGRSTTTDEDRFLADGGYGFALAQVRDGE